MTDVQALAKDFADLKTSLQELGVIGNAYGKTAGIMEKQQSKLQAAFKKNPIVQFGKSILGVGKQLKLFHVLQTQATNLTDEQREEYEKNATGLTKLMATMVTATAYGKMQNKMVKNGVSLWRRLTMSVFGILSIFLLVAFAIAAVSVAFSGAESPLLEYTDGVFGADQALQGLILALTGEGEGGFLGALNVVTAALFVALPVWFLFGAKAALISGGLILVAGAFQLVKKHTGSTMAAFVAAAGVAATLIGVFLTLKAVVAAKGFAAAAAANSWSFLIGSFLVGVGLIAAGIVGLWAFATGKVKGWVGWALGAISAFAIGVGVAILVGFSWPLVGIVAAIVFVVAIFIRYKDKILEALYAAGMWVVNGVIWAFEWIAAIIASVIAIILGALSIVVAVLYGILATIAFVIITPFKVIYDVLMGLYFSFTLALAGGWRGVLKWLRGVPKEAWKIAKKTTENIINMFIGGYNKLAKKLKIKIPKWVPKVGGKSWGLKTIPKVKLAKGGIVNKPTNALIGEDGPEAVIPLTKKNNPQGIGLGGLGGGPITINVNVGGVTDRTDKRALAREIGEAIREEMNRSGRGYGNRRGAL